MVCSFVPSLSFARARFRWASTKHACYFLLLGGFLCWVAFALREKKHRALGTAFECKTQSYSAKVNGILRVPKRRALSFVVSSCVVLHLAESFETAIRKASFHPLGEVISVMSPAVLKRTDEKLDIYCRIWSEAWKGVKQRPRPMQRIVTNSMWVSTYSLNTRFLSSAKSVGIVPSIVMDGEDGPQDVRAFSVNLTDYLIFNAYIKNNGGLCLFTESEFIWNVREREVIPIKLHGRLLSDRMCAKAKRPHDKNWSPLVHSGRVFFVRFFEPLQVLECHFPSGDCSVVHGPENFDGPATQMRGGTPFVQLQGNYYWSLTHRAFHETASSPVRSYYMYLVVLRVFPFRVVFVSDHIKVDPAVLRTKFRPWWTQQNFAFPTSLFSIDHDSAIVGLHVNDFHSYLMKITGLQQLFKIVNAEVERNE